MAGIKRPYNFVNLTTGGAVAIRSKVNGRRKTADENYLLRVHR